MNAVRWARVTPMKHALGISSPSREFMEIGLAIPQGLALGIAGGTPAALAATNLMVMRVAGVGVSGLGASGGGMGAAGRRSGCVQG
jgi:hypothetical protein